MTEEKPVTLQDLDEALHWAALTQVRGKGWEEWVDQLLDVRNTMTTPTPTPATASVSTNKTIIETKKENKNSKKDLKQ